MAVLVLPFLIILYTELHKEMFNPGNNLLLGDRYDMMEEDDRRKVEYENQLQNKEIENIKYSEWGPWRCKCQRRIQVRTRVLEDVMGLAFFSKKSLQQERLCTQADCPQCPQVDCL